MVYDWMSKEKGNKHVPKSHPIHQLSHQSWIFSFFLILFFIQRIYIIKQDKLLKVFLDTSSSTSSSRRNYTTVATLDTL